MNATQTYEFQAEVTQVLSLVINSLYSHKEIFLRELISNASDALDRLRFRAIREPDLLTEGEQLRVRVEADPELGTLSISDNGTGMTESDLAKDLGTIAWSGSRAFVEGLEKAKDPNEQLQLIGQFGVGFYSAFLVADRVQVTSRAAGQEQAFRWSSEGKGGFTIEPSERHERGTSVVLFLKADQKQYLDEWRIRDLVARFSDFVGHPIELLCTKTKDGAQEKTYEQVNRASALWQRAQKEVQPDQYVEFYKHLSHDWEAPLGWKHFHIEGTQMFAGILFIPKRRGMDLMDPEPKHGLRLHVRRVFVMDDCEDLLPRWLRFVRGVVDSEDLPLNVSRELLQDSKAIAVIRKQLVQQTLDLLDEIAASRPEDYETFWKAFGAVLKEGLHFAPEHRDRLVKLVRYESTAVAGLVSLDAAVDRMKPDQKALYYAAGFSKQLVETGPHLEALKRRGYEVLLMTDPVDPFAVATLGKVGDKQLVNVMDANLPLDETSETPAPEAPTLFTRIKEVLGDRVSEVRRSTRLTESPACLVTPEGGLAPHVAQMLRLRQLEVPPNPRILEVNLDHPLVKSLAELCAVDSARADVEEWIRLLHEQALIAEGSPLEEPAPFAQRVARMLTQLVTVRAAQTAETSREPPS
ncbi:MAG: molecular chaperone HtpG [Polyangiaceae bacterium]|nr:molecular chaperone HtpG [Polyangiaceae bacterium]